MPPSTTKRLPKRCLEIAWAAAAIAGLSAGLWISACGRSEPPPAKGSGDSANPSNPSVLPAAHGAGFGAPDELPEPAIPGWAAVAWTPGSEKIKLHTAAAAFALPKDQSLYPGLPAAGLSATFNGTLAPEKGRYRFSVHGQGGQARLTIYGSKGGNKLGEATSNGLLAQSAWIALDGAPITVSIAFDRAGSAECRLATSWEREGISAAGGFIREPLPISAVSVPRYASRDVAAAQSELHGRVLLGELNCISCHDAGAAGDLALTRRPAPLLGQIGRRASPEWLGKWVLDPQAMKPGSPMPDVIGDSPQDLEDADAITHFLVSLGGPVEWESVATESQVVDLGSRIYHSVGCISCHGALEPATKVFGDTSFAETGVSTPPHPFGHLAGKWRPGALAEFLADPLATHPSGRMPNLKLSPQEADLVATYLINAWGHSEAAGRSGFEVDPAKVDAGRIAFAARGCADCHSIGHNLPDVAPTLAAKPLAQLKGGAGCLVAGDPKTPRYTLEDQDRIDLAAGIEAIKRIAALGGKAPAPLDAGQRAITAFGCLHCHEKDTRGGIPDDLKLYCRTTDDTELGDEGRLPPDLTGVGFKLHTSWMHNVLTAGAVARPYMATRMPQFGATNIGELAAALSMMDGVVPGTDAREPQSRDELILAGRTLVGETGLNCISCHTFNGKAAGLPGPDITGFGERLRYEWWKPYLMEPTRFKPGTRMTAFYREGHSSARHIFGGDPDRQADALWTYFNTGKFGPAPEGLPAAAGMPVRLSDRPIVFRTFLKSAGARGIAVGYPIGLHFGFNAEQVRLVDAWQGDFVDATSAWKGRGGMVASGQGQTVWKAPPGPPLIIAAEAPQEWPTQTGAAAGFSFQGYRLEPSGTPIFMYRIGEVTVEEQFAPAGQGILLKRRFDIAGLEPGDSAWLALDSRATARLADGGTLEVQDRGEIRIAHLPAGSGTVTVIVEVSK